MMELRNDQANFSNCKSQNDNTNKIQVVYTDTRIEEKIPDQLNISPTMWKTAKAIALKGTIESISSLARILGISRMTARRHCNDLSAIGLVEMKEHYDYKSYRQFSTSIKNIGIELCSSYMNPYRQSPDEQKKILNELFPDGSPGASTSALVMTCQQTDVCLTTNKYNKLPKVKIPEQRQKNAPTPKRVVIKKRKNVSVLREHLQKMLSRITYQSIGGVVGVSKLIACLYDRYGWDVLAGYLMSFFKGPRKFPPTEFSWKEFFEGICSAIDADLSGFAEVGREVIIT